MKYNDSEINDHRYIKLQSRSATTIIQQNAFGYVHNAIQNEIHITELPVQVVEQEDIG